MNLGYKRGPVNLPLLRRTELLASLDVGFPVFQTYSVTNLNPFQKVYGEGRLNNDKKPGLISSRTRAATRNFEQIDHNGVIPKRATPRYDLNGDLTWYVTRVMDCRVSLMHVMIMLAMLISDLQASIESDSIEFLLKMAPSYVSKLSEFEQAWEDVSVLNLLEIRWCILEFYHSNPSAYGKEEILDIWKMREDRSERPTQGMILRLEDIKIKAAKLEAQLELLRVQAEEAAKKKADAKAAKSKANIAKNKAAKAAKSGGKGGKKAGII